MNKSISRNCILIIGLLVAMILALWFKEVFLPTRITLHPQTRGFSIQSSTGLPVRKILDDHFQGLFDGYIKGIKLP